MDSVLNEVKVDQVEKYGSNGVWDLGSPHYAHVHPGAYAFLIRIGNKKNKKNTQILIYSKCT